MESNELLQIIGKLYTDLYRVQNVAQQFQGQLQEKDQKIKALESELSQHQTTITQFKAAIKTDDS